LTRFRYNLSRESFLSLARITGLFNSVQRRMWSQGVNPKPEKQLVHSPFLMHQPSLLKYYICFKNIKNPKASPQTCCFFSSAPLKHWDCIPSSALLGRPCNIVTMFMSKEKEGNASSSIPDFGNYKIRSGQAIKERKSLEK